MKDTVLENRRDNVREMSGELDIFSKSFVWYLRPESSLYSLPWIGLFFLCLIHWRIIRHESISMSKVVFDICCLFDHELVPGVKRSIKSTIWPYKCLHEKICLNICNYVRTINEYCPMIMPHCIEPQLWQNFSVFTKRRPSFLFPKLKLSPHETSF